MCCAVLALLDLHRIKPIILHLAVASIGTKVGWVSSTPLTHQRGAHSLYIHRPVCTYQPPNQRTHSLAGNTRARTHALTVSPSFRASNRRRRRCRCSFSRWRSYTNLKFTTYISYRAVTAVTVISRAVAATASNRSRFGAVNGCLYQCNSVSSSPVLCSRVYFSWLVTNSRRIPIREEVCLNVSPANCLLSRPDTIDNDSIACDFSCVTLVSLPVVNSKVHHHTSGVSGTAN